MVAVVAVGDMGDMGAVVEVGDVGDMGAVVAGMMAANQKLAM